MEQKIYFINTHIDDANDAFDLYDVHRGHISFCLVKL